jgi:hypothetical protein
MSNLPPPPLLAPPQPVMGYEPAPSADDQHLRLLAIFQYVWGGLMALASLVGLIHVVLGLTMIFNAFADPLSSSPPPASMGWIFLFLGLAILAVGWTFGGLTIYSGRCMARRRHRAFSLVMAAVHCLNIPLGTILGVCTFIVLMRPSVIAQYHHRRTSPA